MKTAIVITTYNRAALIAETLESVMRQTDSDYEVVIVDDASRDHTEEVVKEFFGDYPNAHWDYMKLPENNGQAAATNIGVARSDSKYILTLDSDDLIAPTFLETTIPWLDSSEYDIVQVNIQFFGAMNHMLDMTTKGWSMRDLWESNCVGGCSPFTRNLFCKAGGYDSSYDMEDWHFWIKCFAAGARIKRLPDVLFHYRWGYGDQRTDSIDATRGVKQIRDYITGTLA